MKNTKSTTPAVYVGLDVHKSSIVVAYALADGSTPVIHGKLGGSNLALERGLLKLRKKLGVDKAALRVCYEAGPTGFVAARRLLELGYDTIIVAPSKIQRAPGERVKTDRKDAVKLARLHRSGDLEGIHIPAPDDEAIRDVCRARTDASDDRRKAKQRLGAFLLRNGIHYTGKSKWTAAHMRYLRDLKLPSDTQQIVLEEYLQAIDSAHERTERLADRLETLLLTWDRADYVLALMAMRGFKLVAAMTVIAELGDLSRFRHPRQLMAYLGLVPGERSTGTRRRQGGITKCGNGHARWMLVEKCRGTEAFWTERSEARRARPAGGPVESMRDALPAPAEGQCRPVLPPGRPEPGGQETQLAGPEPALRPARETRHAKAPPQQDHHRGGPRTERLHLGTLRHRRCGKSRGCRHGRTRQMK